MVCRLSGPTIHPSICRRSSAQPDDAVCRGVSVRLFARRSFSAMCGRLCRHLLAECCYMYNTAATSSSFLASSLRRRRGVKPRQSVGAFRPEMTAMAVGFFRRRAWKSRLKNSGRRATIAETQSLYDTPVRPSTCLLLLIRYDDVAVSVSRHSRHLRFRFRERDLNRSLYAS